jgi:hypothetical protein
MCEGRCVNKDTEFRVETKPEETSPDRNNRVMQEKKVDRTLESGLRENSGMERNSSSEMNPLALRSSWQKRS